MVLAIVLHIVFTTVSGLLLSLIFGKLTFWISIASLSIATILCFALKKYYYEDVKIKLKEINVAEIIVIALIIIVGFRHFAYLLFEENNSIKLFLVKNFGDLPMHITYIRNIASGAVFPPDNPIWAFDKLRYPYGIDFYNAIWESLHIPLSIHLFIVGMVLLVASIVMLRWWGGVLVVGAFFLNGGIAGYEVFTTHVLKDYQEPLAWKNFFLNIFITQRAFMIAIPVGVYIIKTGYEYLKGEKDLSTTKLLLVGFLWGILPIFHTHTFIIVSILLVIFTISNLSLKKFLPLLYIAVPLGTILVLYLTNLFRSSSMIHLKLGWLVENDNIVLFWLKNAGPFAVLFIGLTIYDLIMKNYHRFIEWCIYFGLFVIFNIVMMAPWEWDNAKILIWIYLSMAFLSYKTLQSIFFQYNIHSIKSVGIITGICFILFFSGSISVISTIASNRDSAELFNYQDVGYTKDAVKNIQTGKVFAAYPTFNHPLFYWGNCLVMGYSGHLWSHGIKYHQKEALLTELYRGAGDYKSVLKQLKADYIFYGPLERLKYGDNDTAWKKELENVSKVKGYEVYKVK